MKVVVCGYEAWEQDYLTKRAPEGVEFSFYEQSINRDSLPSETEAEVIIVFVDSMIDARVIAHFPQLQAVITRSTGFDHIDLVACRERGIIISNVPAYGEATVAEYVFALILSLSRKIYLGYHQVRESGSFDLSNLRGFDLEGKVLGVVGTGRIGRHVIRIAKGFGLKILANDAYPDHRLAEDLGFNYCSLPELLGKSDIVTLHVPAIPGTNHLLNSETLAQMKIGSVLINTSRGSVVDTEALVRALNSGHLAGAALDVLEEEGVIHDELNFLVAGHPEEHNLKTALANHILIDLPNVIVTPHNAFNTQEALQRILDTTIDNLRGVVSGTPINVVK